MERGYLIIILGVAFAANLIYASPAEDCPDYITSLFLANLEDCYTFYNCSYGTVKLTECPAGLMFNPNYRMCDLPESAGCEVTTKVKFACEENGDRFLPHPTDCSSFYDCQQEQLLSCPDGLQFNAALLVCDFHQNVQC